MMIQLKMYICMLTVFFFDLVYLQIALRCIMGNVLTNATLLLSNYIYLSSYKLYFHTNENG